MDDQPKDGFKHIDKLQSIFHRWENTANVGERSRLSKEVIAGCESIERQAASDWYLKDLQPYPQLI
ncbi:hypothetical protein Fmac_032732 [Flemingia macrophylla]|uniref:Uncharacterized protein n=1 Tax=Flemingia macrophylla TaxID=520843 RepID=A0ABD1L5S9_9FABA